MLLFLTIRGVPCPSLFETDYCYLQYKMPGKTAMPDCIFIETGNFHMLLIETRDCM